VPEPGNPQALNRYAYVYNNPLRYTDPSGHAVAPPACPWCDRPWVDLRNWPDWAIALARGACFLIGCRVDSTAGVLRGPEYRAWLEGQTLEIAGLANPIQEPSAWIGARGVELPTRLRVLEGQGVQGVERLARMIESGVRGAVFEGQRALHYAHQLIGVEIELSFPRGIGRVDLLLTGNRIIETKAWENWENLSPQIREIVLNRFEEQLIKYLSDIKYTVLVEFKGEIPEEALKLLQTLTRDPRYGGRLGWTVIP